MINDNQKLRIFIYGKNALEDLKYLCKNVDNLNKENKYEIIPYIARDKYNNWEYFIFHGEINDVRNKTIEEYLTEHYKKESHIKVNYEYNNIIKNIISRYSEDNNNEEMNKRLSELFSQYRNFYDILVIPVDNLLDEDSLKAFKFFQGYTYNLNQQPFILFLTKKDNTPDVLTLFKFITNNYFDKRNIFAYKFPTNEEEIEDIHKLFLKCMNFYHEIGNYNVKLQPKFFNILICGPEGVGKSTFINQFLHEKLAKEGEGLSITNNITSYYHPLYPIRIIDTPGFESSNSIQIVKKVIENLENDFNLKNQVDLFLYFNSLKERSFFYNEIDLLKYLTNHNKKIVFVLNDFGDHSLKERKRLIDIFKDQLLQISKCMEKDKLNRIIHNIVLIQLKQYISEDEDEDEEVHIKIKQCFGMDKLFKIIYEMFEPHKISCGDLFNCPNIKELMHTIEKYYLTYFFF